MDIASEHAWLRIGAVEKAASIVQLTAGLTIRSVLEIGSGTGAILEQLDHRGYAEQYYAVEPAVDMLEWMRANVPISRLIRAEAATLEESELGRGHYDLAVLSHVLEHLDAPAPLLAGVLSISDNVVVEIPLDGNMAGNARAWLRTRVSGVPRTNNRSRHVQFFSIRDMARLCYWSGGEIVCSRLYDPVWTLAASSPTLRVKRRASRAVGPERWARWYHGHYAVLLRKRPPIPPAGRTRWTQVYFTG